MLTASLEADASTQSPNALQWVPCIQYPVRFQEGQPIKALINSGNEVNAITSAYAAELGLTTRKTSVGAQKIDGSPLENYNIISASFLLQDSLGRVQFFKETFLLADTSMEVVLGMSFLALNNANFLFSAEKLTWRTYTAAEALPTTSWVELINNREFARVALDKNSRTFVIHISTLKATIIHPSQGAQIAALQWDKAPTKIPAKYSNYADVFSSDRVMELQENIGLNEHIIELVEGNSDPMSLFILLV